MTETQHVIALNPYRKGNKGKVFSNSMAVYDKVIASPEIRKMIQQIRGELPIPKVNANDEKAVKKAQDRLKSELPFFCPHYGIFKNNVPIDCIPNRKTIKQTIKTNRDDYPKKNLDSYLEDRFNYTQYDSIISKFIVDTDVVLSIFNMAYQVFDVVRCYKNKVSKIGNYLNSFEFSNELEKYLTLCLAKNLFDAFCSTDDTTYHCIREIERIIDPLQSKYSESSNTECSGKKSRIHLNIQKGMKLDFIRVLNAMYEKGFFKDEQQNKISKKEVFETFGECLNMDLSKFQNDLSRSLTDSTALEKHLKVFEDLKNKMEEIFNSR
jgi:hypothetical protein